MGNLSSETSLDSGQNINLDHLIGMLNRDRSVFQGNKPFPHIRIDSFLRPAKAREALHDFPRIGKQEWIRYLHYNEKKFGLNKYDQLPGSIKLLIDELNSQPFLDYLSNLSGIDNLLSDPTLEGGGLHLSERGGFLNIHADFTMHPHHKTWERRLNLLVYLNPEWEESYLGNLELWDNRMKECKVSVAPTYNRAVIFATKDDSYHGFPDPIQCPKEMTRKSIALYYYTEATNQVSAKATNYKARPGDGLKRILIYFDKKLVGAYTMIKRIFGLNDDFASKVLSFFGRRKKD